MVLNRREKEKQKTRRMNAAGWAKQQEQGRGESTAVRLPPGTEFYKLEAGLHRVDFMPFIAGEFNKRADKGMPHFEREFDIHWVPGPDGKNRPYCCLWSCWKEPCPVCKWCNENAKSTNPTDAELAKSMRAKTRHLWLVNDKPGNADNPLKVLETNHYNKGKGFGEQIGEAIGTVRGGDTFGELEGGITTQLKVVEDTYPGGKYLLVSRIDFIERDYDYPEEVLDKAPCLDDCLMRLSYKELDKVLRLGVGGGVDESVSQNGNGDVTSSTKAGVTTGSGSATVIGKEEDEITQRPVSKATQAKAATKAPADEEMTAEDCGIEVGMEVEHEGATFKVTRISPDGTSLTLRDAKGNTQVGIGPEEVTKVEAKKLSTPVVDDDDDDEDDVPPSKAQRASKKPPAKGKVDEDEDDFDDDDTDEGDDEGDDQDDEDDGDE